MKKLSLKTDRILNLTAPAMTRVRGGMNASEDDWCLSNVCLPETYTCPSYRGGRCTGTGAD